MGGAQVRLNRTVDEAAAQVAIAQTQLQVAAASQRSEQQSQRARLLRAQANLRTAAAEERRYRELYRSGAASASLYESRALSLETARAEVEEARSRLQRLEVRVPSPDGAISLDEARAQRELQAARSHLLRTRAERDDALVRALVHNPPLVLADEPTAALDSRSGREVVSRMQQLAREQHSTILLVTHDNRILDIADRVLTMEDGHLREDVRNTNTSVRSTTP